MRKRGRASVSFPRFWILHDVIYTDDVRLGGQVSLFGPWTRIKIHPKYKDDIALHAHEAHHIAEHWATYWTHYFRYKYSPTYRLNSECAAYAKQWHTTPNADGETREVFARYLLTHYDLIRHFSDGAIRRSFAISLGEKTNTKTAAKRT